MSFFESESFTGSLFFSLRLAFFATIVSIALGVTVALYAVQFAGRRHERIRLFILLPLLLPEILTAIALLITEKLVGLRSLRFQPGRNLTSRTVRVPFRRGRRGYAGASASRSLSRSYR